MLNGSYRESQIFMSSLQLAEARLEYYISGVIMGYTELQIRERVEDNSKINFLISQQKHMLRPLIRTVLRRQF